MGFYIGEHLIPYYGFMIVVGITAAAIVGCIQVKLYKQDINDFIIVAGMAGGGGIAGAKILSLIQIWDRIDFSRIFEKEYFRVLMGTGFVFYGGLIGGLITVLACRMFMKIKVENYVRSCMPCIPIVHGFGRIGCSLVGCCYGRPYEGAFCKIYTESPVAPNGIPLFPVQFTEAMCNFVIATILLIYINYKKSDKKQSLCVYLLLYAPVRFVLETLRYDAEERGIIGWFSTSQWISIGLVVCTLAWLIFNHVKNKKTSLQRE